MSRAFVKEDTPAPPLVPRRAPLPEGARNLVTPRGLALLRSELVSLRAQLAESERARGAGAVESAALRQRLAELEARLASAELVDSLQGATELVRFGARVTLRAGDGTLRTYRIVGVDEANAAEGRVAFVAPIARALVGRRAGDIAVLKTPRGEDEVEIVAVDFEADE